jgi:hypothetical protein
MWTEEHYEHYMQEIYGLEFIAGYTEGGVPYGIPLVEDNEVVGLLGDNTYDNQGEEHPFC